MENTRKEMVLGKISELLENEQFGKKLAECEEIKDICELLKTYGVEASKDEIAEIKAEGDRMIEDYEKSEARELDLEQLDEVAGGGKLGRSLAVFGGGLVVAAFGTAAVLYCPASAPAVYSGVAAYSLAAGKYINDGKKKKKN